MPTAEKRRLTVAEYLAIDSTSEIRHEFLDGKIFAMSGGSLWHNLIKDNFARAVANRLSGGTCRVVTSDQRLKVDATGLYTYPDVLVFCGPPVMEDGVHHTLTNASLGAKGSPTRRRSTTAALSLATIAGATPCRNTCSSPKIGFRWWC